MVGHNSSLRDSQQNPLEKGGMHGHVDKTMKGPPANTDGEIIAEEVLEEAEEEEWYYEEDDAVKSSVHKSVKNLPKSQSTPAPASLAIAKAMG